VSVPGPHSCRVTDSAPAARRLRVLIVDADHRVRDSLSGLLGLGEELEVVGRAGHPAAALELCADLAPDVVVVEPRLPDVAGGLALVAEVRARFPGTTVLVLSWPGAVTERTALTVGADGLLSKSAGPNELVDAIVSLAGAGSHRTSAEPAQGGIA
jgi:DNA-binding NarL/FixJ family response regulator